MTQFNIEALAALSANLLDRMDLIRDPGFRQDLRLAAEALSRFGSLRNRIKQIAEHTRGS